MGSIGTGSYFLFVIFQLFQQHCMQVAGDILVAPETQRVAINSGMAEFYCQTRGTTSRWIVDGTTYDPANGTTDGLEFVEIITSHIDGFEETIYDIYVSVPSLIMWNATEIMCLSVRDQPTTSPVAKLIIIDPTPSISSVTYFVDSATTGRLMITALSPGAYGTAVTYSGSVVEGSGSVVVAGNVLTVTGLEYTLSHTVSITGASDMCTGLQGSNQTSYTFNIAPLTISDLTSSLTCSDPSLPITLTWTIESGTQSTSDLTVPLNPPLIDIPTISYTVGSSTSTVSSASPYILSNPRLDANYTFNVSVSNVASSSLISNTPLQVTALSLDESTVSTMSCLTVGVNDACSEDISTFSVVFERDFGDCPTLLEYSTTTVALTAYSTCLPVDRTSAGDFCYCVSLLHQGNLIATESVININADPCSIIALESFIGGASYEFDSPQDGGTVVHLTRATLSCPSAVENLVGGAETRCINGEWSPSTRRSCAYGAALALMFVLTFVLTLVVGVSIGVLSVLAVNKCRRSERITLQTETEMRPPPAIYEEPDDIKPDPQTQGNMAYGHVQFRQ